MKKFKFQFEAVERVRKRQEEGALRVLADAQRAFQQAQSYKSSLLATLSDALGRREALGARSPATPTDFRMENDFIVGTKQRVIQADQGIVRATRGVEKALRAYLQAKRQTKIIDTLREKAFAEWKKARARHEQKALEDLYVMRSRMTRQEEVMG